MIRITHNIPAASAKLEAKQMVLQERLVVKINDLDVRLQGMILSRPGSPASGGHRKKGWLANSVQPVPASVSGGEISGGVVGGGGDAWYGRLFEDGTTGSYEITAAGKALKFEAFGQTMYLKSVLHPAFDSGRLAFMRPSFEEFRDTIVTEIQETTLEVLAE